MKNIVTRLIIFYSALMASCSDLLYQLNWWYFWMGDTFHGCIVVYFLQIQTTTSCCHPLLNCNNVHPGTYQWRPAGPDEVHGNSSAKILTSALQSYFNPSPRHVTWHGLHWPNNDRHCTLAGKYLDWRKPTEDCWTNPVVCWGSFVRMRDVPRLLSESKGEKEMG